MKEADVDYWNDKIGVIEDSYFPGSANSRRLALAKKVISQKLHHKNGSSILDCGCGTGVSLEILAPLFQKSFGSDFSAKMLETASSRLTSETRPTFFLWDVNCRLPIENWQPVDVVTLFSVLPYIEDWTNFFKELNKVLRPGGLLIATFPNKLFDIYSLNTLSANCFSQELIDENIADETRLDVNSELESLFSGRNPKFRNESAYSSGKIIFKRLNPLTISDELSQYGVRIEKIYFMNNHPVPPSLKAFDSEAIGALRIKRELDLDYNHWSQFFTNSTFMVVGEFQPAA